jgi:DNA-binding transcriptional LysR family regulator
MDVRNLRYALTLAEELHFGRAAHAHFIAAQPFGHRIQQLERDLGTQLFDRTSRRVELTAAGERFLPRARKVLSSLDELMRGAGSGQNDDVLRIGVLGYGLADQWPAVRKLLAENRPDVSISYVELDWMNQYDAVRSGDVDVAILHDVGGADDLRVTTICEVERYAAVPADSELAHATYLTVADVEDAPGLTPVGQPGLRDWRIGRAAPASVEVRSPSNIPAAVAMTGLVGISSEPATRFMPHPNVRYIPLEGPRATSAFAVRRRERRSPVLALSAAIEATRAMRHLSAGACHADSLHSA